MITWSESLPCTPRTLPTQKPVASGDDCIRPISVGDGKNIIPSATSACAGRYLPPFEGSRDRCISPTPIPKSSHSSEAVGPRHISKTIDFRGGFSRGRFPWGLFPRGLLRSAWGSSSAAVAAPNLLPERRTTECDGQASRVDVGNESRKPLREQKGFSALAGVFCSPPEIMHP